MDHAIPDLVPNRFPVFFILEAAKIVLTNNNFMFNDRMFTQISGIILPVNINAEQFKTALNELHPAITFTVEEAVPHLPMGPLGPGPGAP